MPTSAPPQVMKAGASAMKSRPAAAKKAPATKKQDTGARNRSVAEKPAKTTETKNKDQDQAPSTDRNKYVWTVYYVRDEYGDPNTPLVEFEALGIFHSKKQAVDQAGDVASTKSESFEILEDFDGDVRINNIDSDESDEEGGERESRKKKRGNLPDNGVLLGLDAPHDGIRGEGCRGFVMLAKTPAEGAKDPLFCPRWYLDARIPAGAANAAELWEKQNMPPSKYYKPKNVKGMKKQK
eukprot:g12180.t1